MMGLIIVGIVSFMIMTIIEDKNKLKKSLKAKITHTDLTDFEL